MEDAERIARLKAIHDRLATQDTMVAGQFFATHRPHAEMPVDDPDKLAESNPLAALARAHNNAMTILVGHLTLSIEAVGTKKGTLNPEDFARVIKGYPGQVRAALEGVRERLDYDFENPQLRDQAEMHLRAVESFRDLLRKEGAQIIADYNAALPPGRPRT